MSFFDSEKLQADQKANLDLLEQVNGKVLKSVEQLSQLQLAAMRVVSEESFNNVRTLFSARDPQSFAAAFSSMVNPAQQAERLQEFNRKVYDLLSSTQADIAKLGERQAAQSTQQMQDLVAEIAKNAPAGSEPAIAMMKSAVEGANSVYESAQKTAKQAAEMAESGLAAAAAAGQATPEASKATGGARK
ncbi:TIGR01841 family phasin [Pseudomonas sp. SA3-5]|uniref:TIGR01841 family phasin n=1 Tax=Pseudomonas aestuarii TaxID=3018340 RepID=A0ABT4XJN5_9PSED|nr:TIGR01841 family phasin [Pseudomonas aestuarii]MDA7088433.1 TIGR01841 family phasin [Pseudomonas aestuarii]